MIIQRASGMPRPAGRFLLRCNTTIEFYPPISVPMESGSRLPPPIGPRASGDAQTGQPVSPPLQHQDKVFSANFSPNGRWVVTASNDHTARVWDAQTGQPVSPPLQHHDKVFSANFSPNGRWVVTASNDRTARVWDAQTGQPISPPLQHQDVVYSASFSPDGSRGPDLIL